MLRINRLLQKLTTVSSQLSLAILGAGGHGKVLADIAELNGWQNIVFYDDAYPTINKLEHWQVVGTSQDLIDKLNANAKNHSAIDSEIAGVIVGIGNNCTRLRLQQKLLSHNAPIVSLIHPTAVISRYSKIDLGCVVKANAVINPFVQIAQACIINTACSIDHDCSLAAGVHVSPGVNIAGGVKLGQHSWLSIGSSVKPLVQIGDNVIVGAGAVVVDDIDSDQIVVGVPANPLSI